MTILPDALAGDDGTILGFAVDHRDSFHAALAAAGWLELSSERIVDLKLDILDVLAPGATMVLVDDATLERAREQGRPIRAPFAMPLEASSHRGLHEIGRTHLLEFPGPADMVRLGASAAKLLLPIRLDHAERANAQFDVAARTIESCHDAGLPLILEPIVWQAPDERIEPRRFSELVIATATRLALHGPGLLKLQYPGSAEACRGLHEACGGHPWVLLGGGAPLDDLVEHVREACDAGAIGCIVGRSLFAGALQPEATRRRAYLRDIARPELARLAEAVAAGRPSTPSESPT